MIVTVGTPRTIQFRIDTKGLEEAFRRAPSSSYYWLRGFMGGELLRHRNTWLRGKGTKFGRGADGVKVHRLNEGPAAPADKDVIYRVLPKDKRIREPVSAGRALNLLEASAFAGSVVLRVHQHGEKVAARPDGWMALPIRTRPGSPGAWRARNPGKVLISRPSRRDPNRLLLLERSRVAGRGRPRAGQRRRRTERLRLRFMLVKSVQNRPTLKFYETWDALRAARDAEWSKIADRLVKDIARGVTT